MFSDYKFYLDTNFIYFIWSKKWTLNINKSQETYFDIFCQGKIGSKFAGLFSKMFFHKKRTINNVGNEVASRVISLQSIENVLSVFIVFG